MSMVAGVFKDADAAQHALKELLAHHYDTSQISILVSDHHHRDDVTVKHETGIGPGAEMGAVVGALLGATLMATGVLLGPGGVIGAGPAAALLAGTVGGAATGTAYGALAGMGFWDEVAELHAAEIGEGAVWIGVHAEGREDDAEEALRMHGALHVVQLEGR